MTSPNPEIPRMKRYEEIEHTADIGLKVYGKDLKELFRNAAFGMFDIIADLEGLKESVTVDIELKGDNYEELLVKWLDELLYNFYTKWVIFFEFDIIDLAGGRLLARARGRHLGENRNRLKKEVKAATYHDLKIEESSDGCSVEIIFDI